ncbi:MBL fold metallo-hydrolase [Alkalilimnicola ehrlichii]|uniref:MBL fold metallo-hydrolase n=1 Tax=Alkalilimnicola ehrlichii TaxID=351052 RepID=A0A3E0WQ49_9GAMM|nr:MBL fold metallo-hydrolase [Alkalilimnicola ehrlichii]RFA26995.1 MBL fold metallo-hydrolase [Alkalilimnicola ehrlichii]RFA34116.1 MBL fold metallo-hydrolase [Alkalilimnicola ehrlichii]
MRQIQPDLWQTEVENPAPGLFTHAYLLVRDTGNVLFYNTGVDDDIDQMAALGGVAYQFLSHRDELSDTLSVFAERFGAELGGHVAERAEFAEFRVPTVAFDKRETKLGNIEVIPTPGHSPGSTSFLVTSPFGKRYLFTGDTLYMSAEETIETAYFERGSDFDAYLESLNVLRALEPDVVISSATGGNGGYKELVKGEWPQLVERASERLRSRRTIVRAS